MSGIGTKGVGVEKVSTGGMSINPGNVRAKINEVTITAKYNEKKTRNEVTVKLRIETEPIGGDFKGFQIDKNDPTQGTFLGRVGTVKASDFPFSTFTFKDKKSGEMITKTDAEQTIAFLRRVAQETVGNQEWFDKDSNYPTWEALGEAFNAEVAFKDVFLNFCLAADKQINEAGYPQYWLFLPKPEKGFKTFGNDTSETPVQRFDPVLHIQGEKSSAKPVGGFTGDNIPTASPGNAEKFMQDEDASDLPWEKNNAPSAADDLLDA
jgi:hypothetical protein